MRREPALQNLASLRKRDPRPIRSVHAGTELGRKWCNTKTRRQVFYCRAVGTLTADPERDRTGFFRDRELEGRAA
jgi:hypothetical protein